MLKIRNLALFFFIAFTGCTVAETLPSPPTISSTHLVSQDTEEPSIVSSPSPTIKIEPTPTQFLPIETTPTLSSDATPTLTVIPVSTVTTEAKPTIQAISLTSTPTVVAYTIGTDTFINGISEPPPGILKEITYFSGGGGLYCNPDKVYEKPEIIELNIFWPVGIDITSCGWDASEEEKIYKIIDPNGNELSLSWADIDINFGNTLSTLHTLNPQSPFGTYQLKFQIGADILEIPIQVKALDGPTIYWFVDDNKIPEKALLVSFMPYEHVKIFRYSEIPTSTDFQKQVVGWQEFTVDEQGNLLVYLKGNVNWQDMYFAVGDISGEALFREVTPYGLQTDTHTKNSDLKIVSNNIVELNSNNHLPTNINCPAAPKSRLNIGFRAQVTFTDGSPNRIRDLPASANVLGTAPEGTGMVILDGPVCDNERIWWKVQTDNGYTGWTAEGAQEEYWLEPVNE